MAYGFLIMENVISPDLNVAIDTPEEEREKSLDLNVGYLEEFDEWELIIRYTGSLTEIKRELNISIEELLGGYAIIRIPQNLIKRLSEYPQIDYIEKPKNLILAVMEGIAASCVNRLRLPDYDLTGEGVLVACLDSGVDFFHEDFQNADGTTRIVALWDQTVPGRPPQGFTTGSEYGPEDINQAIRAGRNEGRKIVPENDVSGHGTAVLGIMAGNGRSSSRNIIGMAPEASIVAVKLGNADERGFPRTTQLMRAIDYSIRYAISVNKPIAINISYGNNYGDHSGDSMLERYIDTVSDLYRVSIAAGAGNDAITGRHAAGILEEGREEIVELYVADYVTAFNLQIWKAYQDIFDVMIEAPTGRRVGPFGSDMDVWNYRLPGENISVYYSEPTPYNPQQEIFISWIPRQQYITPGIWKIILIPKRIVSGVYNMWLPVRGSTSAEVSFSQPDLYRTLVIPSTARSVISVAAYNSINNTQAVFSGRGTERSELQRAMGEKPDLAAPGVDINSCLAGGGYGLFTGTSFAAPFVTGAAALLMQWGIINGNDPYMYGEKIRVNLIRGAKELPFQQQRPSPLVGWGALCVRDSLPV